ncbi:hypothetical protein CPB83DRAFT_852850 [Crepidotus variabilis]|uniref:Uncharacterized protein n=1 Tax=Crepidotus variabilis TaxID=179855 RepID=A0A9P6JQ43_9AGAR|nr:hypothetical protein CPB83DRAFT_852850 [Crepidotus variabilis]
MASRNDTKFLVKTVVTSDPTMPSLVIQVTQMVNTYMLWVGVASSHDSEAGENAVVDGRLCKDWACAMPPRDTTVPASATSLFRSGGSDVALSISQRLAKRFRKQIFLSVDLPLLPGQGEQLAFEAEKGIVETLKAVET